MKHDQIAEFYDLIASGISGIKERNDSINLRKEAINNMSGFKKVAFDTRRIDQGLEIIPRRGLQNYHRSESFISQGMQNKINNLQKLKNVLSDIKDKYEQNSEWQDSYARVLDSTLENGLRISFADNDYSENQQSTASLDYIEELLQVRYRLGMQDIEKLGELDLEKLILSKDESLIKKIIPTTVKISKNEIATQSYDTLMEKLFGNVKASENQKYVKRTVTITIEDSLDESEK